MKGLCTQQEPTPDCQLYPHTSPPPHLFDLQLKMPPPSTAVSPTPQLSPHLTQVSISSPSPSYWAPQSNYWFIKPPMHLFYYRKTYALICN